MHDHSAVFAFGNPNADDGESCVAKEENSVQFCTERFWMNGQDLVAKIAENRRLSEKIDSRAKVVMAQSKTIAEQEALLVEQQKQISSFEKVLSERRVIIAQLLQAIKQ